MTRRPAPKLTTYQRARVRSMIEDEGATRAEAIAWVLAMEDAVSAGDYDRARTLWYYLTCGWHEVPSGTFAELSMDPRLVPARPSTTEQE